MLEKQNTISHYTIAAERAIDELRRQRGVIIEEENGHAIANYPVEFLDETLLSSVRVPFTSLLITAARAKTLGLGHTELRIDASTLSLEQIQSVCDPLAPAADLPQLSALQASLIDAMALKLVKYASLLPALLLADEHASPATSDLLRLPACDLASYISLPLIDVIPTARAQLPIAGAENAAIISFRARHSSAVHLALVIGDISAESAPLTRIHSSCVTGDILGSLRCDCGYQLKRALEDITRVGSGILIYLHQEGRGIGITNKLRAYQLQERGIDTYTANLMLGFDEDERDFSIAAAMLKHLGTSTVRLLTNNPGKPAALEKSGITITERIPLVIESGAHNHAYLEAKSSKAGHLF